MSAVGLLLSVPLNVLLCVLLRPVMCFSSDVSATGEAPMFPSFSSPFDM